MEKKVNVEGEGISREGGRQKEGEKREQEREKEGRLRGSTWKLPVVVVVYGRHTGVTRTLACVRSATAARTHTRTQRMFYTHIRRGSAARYHTRMAAIESTRA